MTPPGRYLPIAAVLPVALLALPALAGSETAPAVEAVNVPGSGPYEERHSWSPAQVTVAAGGTVTFRNPGSVNHGIHWVSGPATPTCSSGVPVGTEATASGSKWSGTCTFAQAGAYTFYCTVHPTEMRGTITVSASGTTTITAPAPPPTPSGPTPSAPPAPGPANPETPAGQAPVSPALKALELAAGRRGVSVRGSVEVLQAGVGGRLEVDLFARRALLARAGPSTETRVGRLLRTSLRAGRTSFAVPLDAKARRVLRARRRLGVTVAVSLAPARGSATTLARDITLHA